MRSPTIRCIPRIYRSAPRLHTVARLRQRVRERRYCQAPHCAYRVLLYLADPKAGGRCVAPCAPCELCGSGDNGAEEEGRYFRGRTVRQQ